MTSKLDFITIKEWESSIEFRKVPTFNELIEFLTKRCQMLEAVTIRCISIPSNNSNNNARPLDQGKVTNTHASLASVKCTQCKGEHQIYQCKTFKELPVAERLNKVKSLKLCLNCLKPKHKAKECSSGNCKKCSKKHNTLLHEDRNTAKENKEETNNKHEVNDSVSNKAINTICTYAQSNGVRLKAHILIDSFS